MSPLVRLEKIKVIFNRDQENECIALNHIDLEIRNGEYITIWGGNGAGKSSLLNVVSGSALITSGRVFFDERDITSIPEFRRARFIGRITQNPFDILAGSLTLEENLALAYLRGKKRSFRRAVTSKFREMIKAKLSQLDLGLENRLRDSVYDLSGGERQALTLLMVELNPPDILLLDEHTAALDIEKNQLIENLTDTLVREHNITTLWVTHKKEQAARFSDRILFMRKGKILRDMRKEEKREIGYQELLNLLEQFQMENSNETEFPS